MIFGLDIEIFVVCGLLVLLLYFALSRTIFSARRKGRNGIRYSVITTLIATPILFYISIVSVLFFKLFVPEFQKDFDKTSWTELKELRFEMRDDLVESKILENKSKAEVIDLLGEPDRKDTTGTWTYDLGVSKAGFGWQFNDLKIHFDNDRVEETELIEIID
tara:strand:- start:239 stop:724 length:486 start_codon:yes stop_codon:yes gene_type:complete